jgi:uncharacterized protein (TIGR04255 family)
MVLGLPAPDRRQLLRSPLVLTVCQVRFEETLALADPRVAISIQSALGGASGPYPRMEQLKAPAFQLSVSAQGGAETQQLSGISGWRLQSDDAAWTVSIMTNFVALETSRYSTWEDFGPRMAALLDALTSSTSLVLEERLGLRYVDRLTGLAISDPADWNHYVDSHLLGALRHGVLGPAAVSTQQQIDLRLDGDVRCILRHGHPGDADENGTRSYVLDYDIYRQAARPFDAAGIKDALETFGDAALQLFHASLNPAYLDWLREGEGAYAPGTTQ